ncbi:hypothetical protein A4A49_36931 [Nicotiana attenuata]|uniref:Uncharacterized protein n=1 Tax=Nicotiana attenuata TaxID=49451 RepID=A0A1J6IZM2_NICAT|nr:hypothetical protein A4A49_36931 [Nicotiana attenuata]
MKTEKTDLNEKIPFHVNKESPMWDYSEETETTIQRLDRHPRLERASQFRTPIRLRRWWKQRVLRRFWELGFMDSAWQPFYGVLENLRLHFHGNLRLLLWLLFSCFFRYFWQLFCNGLRCLLDMVLLLIFLQKSYCRRDFGLIFLLCLGGNFGDILGYFIAGFSAGVWWFKGSFAAVFAALLGWDLSWVFGLF